MVKLFTRGLWCMCACAVAAFGWTSGEITVDVTNSPMNIKVSAAGKTLAEITGLKFGGTSFTTLTSSSSTADALTINVNANYTLTISGVSGGIHVKSNTSSVTTVMITLKDQGEHFYGITQHNVTKSPDLRGQGAFKDQMAAYQGLEAEDAEVYGGFYYTNLGYGAYFDTYAYGVYSFGVSNTTTISYNTSAINWYLFYGPNLSKIQSSLYKVIGAPKKVPMWACGPVVWHDNFSSGSMMISYADSFSLEQTPYSTMWLDRPYNDGTSGWSNMNFEGGFANPGVWLKSLINDYYVNFITWIMPGYFSAPPAEAKYLTSKNYYFDLTDASTVAWYKNKLKTGQYQFGVKGHKLDRVDNGWVSGDGIVTLPAFSDGTPEPERHKKYAFLNCKISDESLRTTAGLGDDQFEFTRCAVVGSQKYVSAIWNGDTDAGWSGLVVSVGNALRTGFLGFPMWGSDICGYNAKSKVSIDIYTRWLMFGVYSGFMELMLDFKGPWLYTASEQTYIKNIFNLRFDLLPYIYSIINTAADNGVTMMPLVGEYPDDSKTYALTDEYLFGPAMLVAPFTSATATRSLYLPAGKWINAWNYADEQNGSTTITSPTMAVDQIPVYIKSNSIYPTGQVFAGLAKKWDPAYDSKRNITINTFPGAAGESNSFTYVDYVDADKKKVLTVSVTADNVITVSAPAMTIPGNVVVRLPAAPTTVFLGSTPVASPQYDATAKKLTVPFVANQAVTVTVNGQPVKTLEKFEPVQAHGIMQVRNSGGKTELIIPRMTGINLDSRAKIAIFDMAGKNIIKKECILKQYSSTPVFLSLGKGAYIARVKVNGIDAGYVKIVAQ
jgi:alpha-glucosidase (family GH31 glycosyl hydrolase)